MFAFWAEPLPAQGADPLGSEVLQSDADLTDVCFVDLEHGWAVGDRGAIWHTADGGDHWQLQRSGVSCRLESVCFVDQRTGWAAGGYSHPLIHSSSGVLLSTTDGGQHWSVVPKLILPALKQIRFFGPRNGWAVGDCSAMYPTGIFTTQSGGREWQALPGPRTAGWLCGAFLEPEVGVVAGRYGELAAIRQPAALEAAACPPAGLRALWRLKLIQPGYGWLVGEGGLVWVSGDAGGSWRPAAGDLPPFSRCFDFTALEVRGPKCWIAGCPGTLVYHTADAGRTWRAYPTGQTLPIESLVFADEQHGWAVGALGSILVTSDGGQTWRAQRAAGARVALLGFLAEPGDLPLELLADLCANDGYKTVVELVGRRDVESRARSASHPADRTQQAASLLGASARSAWQFPLRQPGLKPPVEAVVGAWDEAHGGRGLAELEAHLVRKIRQWRPDVVFTHDPNAAGADASLAALVGQVVMKAVQQAADPGAHPEMAETGLAPWQPAKLLAGTREGVSGTIEVLGSQLAGRLGRSLADLAAGPRLLVEDRARSGPNALGFYPVFDQVSSDSSRKEFFSGLTLAPGSASRRMLVEPSTQTLDTVRQRATRRRHTQAILDRVLRDPQGASRLLAEIGPMLEGMDRSDAAQMLLQMSEAYAQRGQWPIAAESLEMLLARGGDPPLARAALRRLARCYTSAEVQRHSGELDKEALLKRANALASRLEQAYPDLLAEPQIGYALAALNRRSGQARLSEQFYLAQRRRSDRDAWQSCASGEAWLADPKGPAPKPVLPCAPAPAPPHLDGQLDDPVWKAVRAVELHSPQGIERDWPTSVWIACDAQFLYLAIRAGRGTGAAPASTSGRRPRDPDLSARDRVELYLDVDRDYGTCLQLSIDDRGWGAESCAGDPGWNPGWFVASSTDKDAWTAEAAVPLVDLVARPPTPGTAWGLGLQRVLPSVGFLSWSLPAAVEPIPEGFGYLRFP